MPVSGEVRPAGEAAGGVFLFDDLVDEMTSALSFQSNDVELSNGRGIASSL